MTPLIDKMGSMMLSMDIFHSIHLESPGEHQSMVATSSMERMPVVVEPAQENIFDCLKRTVEDLGIKRWEKVQETIQQLL